LYCIRESNSTEYALYCCTAAQDFARASELATTELESATVLKATAMASRVLCACIPNKSAVESERQAKFVQAVREYEWDIAEVLAISAGPSRTEPDPRPSRALSGVGGLV